MLGGQMAGGGIGVAVPEELILLHAIIEMGVASDASALRRFAPLFVESVEKWRSRAKDICDGKEVPSVKEMGGSGMPGGRPGIAPGHNPAAPGPGGKPGERFIKI